MQLQKINKKQEIEIDFTPEQVALLKSQIATKATDDELKLFLNQCKRTGLDPFSRQIYAIHRSQYNADKKCYENKMTIQTSIDGFRVIAERSGDYAGQDEPIFNEVDGKLISCKVTVYRFKSDQRYAASVGVAYFDEFKQTGKDGKESGMWAKMPHVMLSKVAEAIALRKAYPQDLSGLYTGEEMDQSSNENTPNEEKKTSIEDYNAMLMNCTSIDELKMFKSILPVHVLRNEEFKKAAIERYNQIDEKSWLNEYDKKGNTTKEWLNVCEALETKKYTIEEVQSKFKLSKEMKAKLLNILKYENIKKEEPKIEQDIHELEFEHKIF